MRRRGDPLPAGSGFRPAALSCFRFRLFHRVSPIRMRPFIGNCLFCQTCWIILPRRIFGTWACFFSYFLIFPALFLVWLRSPTHDSLLFPPRYVLLHCSQSRQRPRAGSASYRSAFSSCHPRFCFHCFQSCSRSPQYPSAPPMEAPFTQPARRGHRHPHSLQWRQSPSAKHVYLYY